MKRSGLLSLQFYRLLLLYNIAFTVLWFFLFLLGLGHVSEASFFIAKITGFVSAVAIHFYASGNCYYYFRNAGYSIRRVMLNTFAFDLLIYFIAASLIKLIVHAYLKG